MIFTDFESALTKLALITETEHKKKYPEYLPKKPAVTLKPHQERVHRKLLQSPGMLVYHGLGSGKTITSITAADALGLDAEAVVPAALRPNYEKEIQKVGPQSQFNVKSYEGFAKNPDTANKLLIFDEAQRLQDPSSRRTLAAIANSPTAAKRIGLSGTPIQNRPEEIAPLLNILAGKRVLPTGEEFQRKFIGEREVKAKFLDRLIHGVQSGYEPTITNRDEFAKRVRGLVDYHPSVAEGFPKASIETVETPMSSMQSDVYDYITQSNRSFWNKVERNLPPNKRESRNLNAFMSGARQVSNTPAPFRKGMSIQDSFNNSPKMQQIVADVQKGIQTVPKFKSVVYSNYIGAGVAPVAHALAQRGIPHHVFTGGMSDEERKQKVDDFNNDRVKVLLISGAGAEGLDLKGTRMVQIMEPHWNESRIKQVIGRAIRFRSHDHLPPEHRHVDVKHYQSTMKPGLLAKAFGKKPKTSADQYLKNLASSKQKLIDQFLKVLQEEGSRPA